MITSQQAQKRYGDPVLEKSLVIYDVPSRLEIGFIPKKIYCNWDIVKPLELALTNVVSRGLAGQIKTWDGCFNIRKKRGALSVSLHAWGLAIDINAANNGLGKTPTLSPELVACFESAGFEWGGRWRRADGMHFQLAKLPG